MSFWTPYSFPDEYDDSPYEDDDPKGFDMDDLDI